MANPIKTSDILQDDGAIQSAIDQLKAFEKQAVDSMSKVKEEAKKLKKEMNGVNTTTARGREETEEAAKKTDEIARRYKKYQDSLTETGQEIAALKLAQQQLNQVNKLTAKQNSALEGSYNDLSAQLSLLKIRWKQLSEEERENGEEGKKLTKQIKSVNDELIKLDKSVGVASRKVGSYKEAIEEATAASGSFNGVLNLIRKNPIIGVLAAFVGVVGGLFKAFSKSEKGAKLFNKAAGVMDAVLSNIVEISVQVYEKLEAAFKDPLGSLKEFGRTITTQLTNRLKGTLELVVGLGKAIGNTLVLDFDAAKKAAKEAGEAFIKVTTGLDKEQQDEFIDSVKELTKQIEKEADAFAKLYERQRQVRKVTRALNIEVSELAAQEAILSQKAGDTTLGFEEQKKAAEELETILKKKGETEIKLAKNNLSLINTEIKLRRANKEDIEDLLDTQAQAIQTLKEAETSLTVSLLENARERREIKRDEFERELDFAIDVADAQLRQNERIAKSDNTTFKERAQLLDENKEINEKAFQSQINLIEDYTGKKLGLDQLSKESDEALIRERLKGFELDDILQGRILEVIKERKAATQDLVELEEDLTKLKQKQEDQDALSLSLGFFDDVKKVKAEIKEDKGDEPDSIFDLLGINIKPEQLEALSTAFDFAKNQLSSYLEKRKEIAGQLVQQANNEVAAAQRSLQAEIESRNAGFANNEQLARQELDAAKKRQKEALNEQKKAQQEAQRLQTIEQAGNLVTAATGIWAQLKFPAALPAIGIMFASFLAAKIKANQLTKKKFGKGTYQEINRGASHESGNDIDIGLTRDGRQMMTVEKNESFAVFNKRAVKKHGSKLKQLVEQINTGQFKGWGETVSDAANTPILNIQSSNNTDTQKMEEHLKAISDNTGRKYSANGKIEWYKNHKIIYN
jgi:hypothetical protein